MGRISLWFPKVLRKHLISLLFGFMTRTCHFVIVASISGCTVETFKLHLDRFLVTVPDEPQVRGYTDMRRAESNSLLHMAQLAGPQRV